MSEDEDEETEEFALPKVSSKEVEKALELVTNYLVSRENIGTENFAAVSQLKRTVETNKVRRQKSIKDYFN